MGNSPGCLHLRVPPTERKALRLSERFDLTLYDAVFLELAQRRALPLATLDRELRAAGSGLGVELLGITG